MAIQEICDGCRHLTETQAKSELPREHWRPE